MSGELLLDNSAWARLGHPSLPQQRAETVAAWLEQGRLVVCLPFLLEAGYSARSGADHAALIGDLLALPRLVIDEQVEERALDAQRQLARVGHHRMPPVDLILAALADTHGLGILHYDSDYDLLAEKTDLSYQSLWLADRGTL
ncbi:MAG: PIN domain-containing protein [Actinomycetota bacterium]|nr:PIN domain-containing protein [Actinomycetota bacterium]